MTQLLDFSRDALIVSAHGVGGEAKAAADQVGRISARRIFASVAVSILGSERDLASTVQLVEGQSVYVCPFLFSDGYTARTVLPREMAALGEDRSVVLCRPIGTSPLLSRVVAEILKAKADADSRPDVVVAAHGSQRDSRSAATAIRVARDLSRESMFGTVLPGFLDQTPTIADSLARVSDNALIVGLFADAGRHGHDDVLAIATRASARYVGPVGLDIRTAELILERVSAAAQPD